MAEDPLTASPATLRRQQAIAGAKTVVVKVGTRVLTDSEGLLNRPRVASLSEQVCRLADTGRQVILVSSGAVGAGIGKLALTQRPTGLGKLQAVAAIGQTELIREYEAAMGKRGYRVAQVLLTTVDLRRRTSYLNIRNTLTEINAFNAIAIVNENDSVAVSELMTTFGDNDRLAASVAGLLNDALMVILSDVDGLFDGDPQNPKSQKIGVVDHLDQSIMDMACDRSNNLSRGGMASKLRAAQVATSHGHYAVIASGHDSHVLDRIFAGESIGTLFYPSKNPIKGVRRWIHSGAEVTGKIIVDHGAAHAVSQRRASLLSVGIIRCVGEFRRGDVVAVCDPDGNELARGLSNYRVSEVTKIAGVLRERIAEVLTHHAYDVVVHCNNMVVHGHHAAPLPDGLH